LINPVSNEKCDWWQGYVEVSWEMTKMKDKFNHHPFLSQIISYQINIQSQIKKKESKNFTSESTLIDILDNWQVLLKKIWKMREKNNHILPSLHSNHHLSQSFKYIVQFWESTRRSIFIFSPHNPNFGSIYGRKRFFFCFCEKSLDIDWLLKFLLIIFLGVSVMGKVETGILRFLCCFWCFDMFSFPFLPFHLHIKIIFNNKANKTN